MESNEDSLPPLLKIFSLSVNFDSVLDALEIKYHSNPLSEDMSGIRVGFVSFFIGLLSRLTDPNSES